MSKNVVVTEKPKITIWLRVARWLSKATRAQAHARTPTHTHTHTEISNTYFFSTATVVTRTRLSVTLYVHCLSCYCFRSIRDCWKVGCSVAKDSNRCPLTRRKRSALIAYAKSSLSTLIIRFAKVPVRLYIWRDSIMWCRHISDSFWPSTLRGHRTLYFHNVPPNTRRYDIPKSILVILSAQVPRTTICQFDTCWTAGRILYPWRWESQLEIIL